MDDFKVRKNFTAIFENICCYNLADIFSKAVLSTIKAYVYCLLNMKFNSLHLKKSPCT